MTALEESQKEKISENSISIYEKSLFAPLPLLAGRSKPTGTPELASRHPMGRLTPSGRTGGQPATAARTRAAGSAGSGRVPRRLARPGPPSLRMALEAG